MGASAFCRYSAFSSPDIFDAIAPFRERCQCGAVEDSLQNEEMGLPCSSPFSLPASLHVPLRGRCFPENSMCTSVEEEEEEPTHASPKGVNKVAFSEERVTFSRLQL